jgi:hypothetical protein
MRCGFCRNPIDRQEAFKGKSEQFHCSEFCAKVKSIAELKRVSSPPLMPASPR